MALQIKLAAETEPLKRPAGFAEPFAGYYS